MSSSDQADTIDIDAVDPDSEGACSGCIAHMTKAVNFLREHLNQLKEMMTKHRVKISIKIGPVKGTFQF